MDKQKQKEAKLEAKKAAFRRVERALKEQGIDAPDFQKKIGIDSQNWNNWKNRGLPTAETPKVAEAAGLRLEYVVTGKGEKFIGVNTDIIASQNIGAGDVEKIKEHGKVPLISWVQAGAWCEAIDLYAVGDAEDWYSCPSPHGKRTFALRVVNDSMTSQHPGQKSYPEGTIIYIDPDREVMNGSKVIAKILDSNEVTFKVYREDGGKRWLVPLNPIYDKIPFVDGMHICGVLIGAYSPE